MTTDLGSSNARLGDAVRREARRSAEVILVSDGFLPFRDNVDVAARHGVNVIVESGGVLRGDANR